MRSSAASEVADHACAGVDPPSAQGSCATQSTAYGLQGALGYYAFTSKSKARHLAHTRLPAVR
ncbi:hypothetical protein VFPFJ_07087 [Purpureocillium lilacinum]|uniref:Uncharacterized protein n=1 Tax=Purpureocillium lilacinum TaxID=33203 RepID=A0A179GPZ0_PURLI|nr:hypothetical protein VFPFJ_07087 [Purpureocillium lilacinum]OAQ79975.1 hypothetical protein VFPBJ_05560 [Purpureocillium lilacinum]OAQ88622.1 hypothetical protein VFPFJ_07087 [Purpureocillium lilacinum]